MAKMASASHILVRMTPKGGRNSVWECSLCGLRGPFRMIERECLAPIAPSANERLMLAMQMGMEEVDG